LHLALSFVLEGVNLVWKMWLLFIEQISHCFFIKISMTTFWVNLPSCCVVMKNNISFGIWWQFMAPKKLPIKGKDVANKPIGNNFYLPLMLTFGKYKRLCNNKTYRQWKIYLKQLLLQHNRF
jgi:hypothetical protein